MILRVDGRTVCGAVADLGGWGVSGAAVAAAVRGEDSPHEVRCPPAGDCHERVGHVRPGAGVAWRAALAAAARSRGHEAPQEAERARLRAELADLAAPDESAGPPTADGPPARDRLAEARERVAQLRGRVRALDERDESAAEARAALRDAVQRLSELETSRHAARERRRQIRERRDRRERRLRLEDRLANLDRTARAHLADAVRDRFCAALAALDPGADPADPPPVAGALAVLRVARVRAPVVLEASPFDGPADAAAWVGAPVVQV